MQKEMQEAGEAGFRFVAVMGGETAIGGKEVVVLMEKAAGDKNTYRYRLLATSKTSTLQKELQEAADGGFAVVGQTVFESTFGGQVKRRPLSNGRRPAVERFEFKLVATSKTSTMEKELKELADAGYQQSGSRLARPRSAAASSSSSRDERPSEIRRRDWLLGHRSSPGRRTNRG